MNKVHRGVVALGVSAVVGAALVAPGVQAAPGVGVSSTQSAVYWDDAQQVGGSGGTIAGGNSVAVASDGTVLVTGFFDGTTYFPRSASPDDSIALTSAGGRDVFVAAMNADDSYFAWARRAGGTGNDYGNAVAVDDTGNVLVTGSFDDTAYFPRSSGPPSALVSAGRSDVFVAALNADDSYFAWAQRAGGTSPNFSSGDYGNSVAVDDTGNVLVTGSFDDTAYFPRNSGPPIALTSAGSEDVFVAALNADDSYFAWARRAGGTGADYGNSVAVAPDGTAVITGEFLGSANFPRSATDSIALTTSITYSEVFVAALNADDSYFAWAQQAGGTKSDYGRSVAVAPDGTVLVTGSLQEETAYFPRSADSDDSIALTVNGESDVFVAALNADDSYFAWAQVVTGTGSSEAGGRSVAVDDSGTVLVTGGFQGTAYFPRSADSDDSFALTSAGGDAVFVAALNKDDSYFAWAQIAGGGGEIGRSVAVAPNGTVLVSGEFGGTSSFPRSAVDSIDLTATGLMDVFVGWLLTPSAPAPPAPNPPAPASPPGAPNGVRGEAGDGRVSVSWTPPVSSGSFAITSYQVTASPGGRGCLVTAPTLACDVTELTNGTAYTFEVRALNGAGWGPWSSASDPVTPQAPGTVSILISGSRGDVRGKPGVKVTGTSTGLGPGAILRPMLRFPGQLAYTQGYASILVDQDGAFTWQRRTGKKTYVYVKTQDGTGRSNRVTIAAP